MREDKENMSSTPAKGERRRVRGSDAYSPRSPPLKKSEKEGNHQGVRAIREGLRSDGPRAFRAGRGEGVKGSDRTGGDSRSRLQA